MRPRPQWVGKISPSIYGIGCRSIPNWFPSQSPSKKSGPGAIALRLTGVTVIAALIAWIVVSLPPMRQRSGNNDVHTALLPNTANSLARHAADAIEFGFDLIVQSVPIRQDHFAT